MKTWHWNALMLAVVVLLVAAPLRMVKSHGESFRGADDQAQEAIAEVAPGYQPWAHPLMEPPSGEVENFLFALQAAIGAGFLGYYFGYRRALAAAERKQA
nr:energy-coupling factor ABC transporter substrate-binding protein [uncultured Holophaga sp.]